MAKRDKQGYMNPPESSQTLKSQQTTQVSLAQNHDLCAQKLTHNYYFCPQKLGWHITTISVHRNSNLMSVSVDTTGTAQSQFLCTEIVIMCQFPWAYLNSIIF